MLASLREIGKYVDINGLTAEEIASRLTFSGIEVEEIKYLSNATNLVIGQIVSCIPHPDSDHLHICKVDVKDEILDIVCGAPNARTGLKVIVAKVGAKLPGGEIKAGEIRGVQSNGMMCALNELGVDPKFLTEAQIKGIEELPSDAPVGEKEVLKYLGLDDAILDLSLLANRSDCYSLYNIAREIGALFDRKVNIPNEVENGTFDANFKVGSETEFCKAFEAKVVKGIEIKESPKWLQDTLRSEGIRSIDNIVDIGNYVMLLTGQPLHMYDLDKLEANELIVKDNLNEDVVALDEKTYHINDGDLIVTSNNKPACIAGVMGLNNVAVDKNTKNIVIEAANFHHAKIRHTSKRLGLSSDSSQRFIKEVNPHQLDYVLNLASRLCKELAGAKEESKLIKYDEINHDPKVILCSYKYINGRLGTDFSKEVINDTLTKLGFILNHINEEEFNVTVPAYRIDVEGKADLSEEVVRYNGFDEVKSSLPYMETTVGGLNVEEKKQRAVEDFLLSNGFDQVLTYTLLNKKDNDAFNYVNLDDGYAVFNPLTEDRKYARRNLLSSMLRCVEYNINHKNNNFVIFETSQIQTKKFIERHLSLAFVGNKYHQDKLIPTPYSYFDAKGIIDTLLHMFNIQDSRIRIERLDKTNEFHPTRSARIYLDGKVLAVLGEVHPKVKNEYSINKNNVVIMEMNLSLLFKTRSGNSRFSPISKFPSVSRDYAFIIKDDVKYLDIKKEIKRASSLIKDIEIFDIYKGEHVKEGYKSVALKVSLESMDHTLKEEEINTCDKKIRDIIGLKFYGEIRQ